MTESVRRFSFEHEGMASAYCRNEDGNCTHHGFVPGAAAERLWDYVGIPPFTVAVAGRQHGGLPAVATAQTELAREMKLIGHEQADGRLKLVYSHETLGLEIAVAIDAIPGCAVLRVETTATNRSERPIALTHLSSAYLQGVALNGIRPWHDENKLRVHYCKQTWAGEGQWRQASLETMGLYPTATHSDRSAFHLSSEGSWSTSRYAPMLVVEDLEAGQVWYAQIETSSPWHFEVGVRGSIWERGERAMYIQADGATERVGGWSVALQPGQSFTTAPVAVGCAEGGFEEAVRELTVYRRSALKLEIPGFKEPPVVYNDYMNGIWADPSRDKLVPLIDAAALCGVEVYCMDAGWYGTRDGPSRILGDWEPSPDKFGPEGLAGIVRYIREKGMTPGIWLELEVCGEEAELGRKPDDWFLRLNGRRVGGGERWFLNFGHPEVKAYLHDTIDRLVAMGVGYIKNDYNACVGPGDDSVPGMTAAAGLLRHARAFYGFIDEVRARHPQLILENCGCGAMRLDYGIQSHFHLASYSDQENYTYATSILAGTLACVLPEQTGIWAYPYPQIIQIKDSPHLLESAEYRSSMADGEQTVYNLVNAMCGVMTLAGRIDKADAGNLALICEGVRTYKRERAFLANAFPIWPLGMPRIGGAHEWAGVGLLSPDRSRLLLAVWRRETASAFCEIPLETFRGRDIEVRTLYPSETARSVQTHYNRVHGKLTVRLPKQNQARLLDIRLAD